MKFCNHISFAIQGEFTKIILKLRKTSRGIYFLGLKIVYDFKVLLIFLIPFSLVEYVPSTKHTPIEGKIIIFHFHCFRI